MLKLQNGVYEFHKKHGFPRDRRIFMMPSWRVRFMLWFVRCYLRFLSKLLLRFSLRDLKNREETYRVHLILEETEEMAEGLQESDEVKTADGLGDLIYVAVGVGVVYQLPCDEICDEIQASNMSKAVRSSTDKRLRNKGPNYFKPDIQKAIAKGRSNADYRRQ